MKSYVESWSARLGVARSSLHPCDTGQKSADFCSCGLPVWNRQDEARQAFALVKRGQTLGFSALVLDLAATVTLALAGQPWVAGILATPLLAIVAIFVTGRYQPARLPAPQTDGPSAPSAELTS